jgi:ribosomal protein S12 methylthiotransferase accessory factor YcaO
LGGLGVSGGSRVNMASAVECAIGEMFFMFNILNRTDYDMKKFENYIPFKTEGVLRNDRLAYWAMKKNFESIAFLFKGEKKKLSEYENKNISSKKEELEILLNKLRTLGQDYDQVYVYEAKNKILKTVGYHVVRAIMPKLYPLYLNEVMALTDSVRLEEFNLWKNGKKDFVINIEPHPFP